MIETVVRLDLPVGEELHIRKNRLSPAGGGPGRRLSVVTGIHGDELEGQYVCYEIQRRVRERPELLAGTVDVYPALNPLGIDSVTRGIPGFDLDMNRIFPGRRDGDMNEAVAAEIVRDLEGSDLCLDIHASNIFITEAPQIRINQRHEDRLLPWARLANVDFVWVHSNATVLESTLAYSLNSLDTPTLVVEMGVGMRITKSYGDQLADGVFRLMCELGIWRGEAPGPGAGGLPGAGRGDFPQRPPAGGLAQDPQPRGEAPGGGRAGEDRGPPAGGDAVLRLRAVGRLAVHHPGIPRGGPGVPAGPDPAGR